MMETILSICAICISITTIVTTIYLSGLKRRNSTRDILYNNLFQIVQEIHSTALQLEDEIDDYLEDDMEESHESFNKLLTSRTNLINLEMKISLFIDDDFDKLLRAKFHNVFQFIDKIIDGETNNIEDEFANVFFELEEALREIIGVNALSNDNRKLLRINTSRLLKERKNINPKTNS